MTVQAVAEVKAASLSRLKMEDRKRPALDDRSSAAPALKRHATSVNGVTAHPDVDMYWKDDIERYQKDAILRQMREYKREKSNLEAELLKMTKRAAHHDDHLRLIDSWFLQLLDEMAVIANAAPLPSSTNQAFPFKSSLLYASNNVFEAHLRQRSKEIRDATSLLFSKFPTPPPDVREMQERLAALLAAEKVHVAEMQRVESEKEQLSDRLENASYRYMVAEKKFDRSKSAQVAKIEAQASATSRPDIAESGSPAVKKEESKPGQLAEDGIVDQEVEIARKELAALAEKRAHQLEALEAENKKLTEDLNNTRLRLSGLTDDDYASSDLFKVIKSQHEDVVKRVNDLETLNIQLRAEAKQLQVERTAYREEADNELRAATIEMESQLARSEADLARIRHARDELVADIGVRKASHDQNKASHAQIQELAGAREARIESLEIELARLRTAVATVAAEDGTAEEEMDPSTARTRLAAVEKDKRLLENELRSMETAFKKASMAASKKIADMTEAEERMVRLAADKAKAEQKFFAAMKAKETREVEARTLRVQNTKSTEIVSQLKEAESSCRALLVNLEKQLAEARDAITVVTSGSRAAQQTLGEQKLSSDRLTTQVEEVKKMLIEKDAAAALAMNAQRKFESTASELQVRLDESQKSLESMRKKGIGHQSEEYEMLRTIAICTVCRKNFKNTALKTCGHVFCQECVDERISARSRKCPNCGKAFGNGDHMRVTL